MKTKFNGILTLLLALVVQVGFAQVRVISGTVSDETGELPGVNVIKKGTTQGVETDFDGKYTIKAKTGDVLEFSFVGMKTVLKTVGKSNTINVTMKSDNVLDEVVVVGYGSQSKKDLTGSVSSISSKELVNKPVANIAQVLQGKSAGLQIVSNGGRAGSSTKISIRGNGSLSASNDALYIIDGVPQSNMDGIAPEDIKNISILKDAASAAIYGSRASNGVIIVETNRSSYKKSIEFNFNTSYGFQNVIGEVNLLNSKQYKQISDVARINYENDIANGVLRGPKNPAILTPLPDSNINTDWLNLIQRKNAPVKNYQFSVSGGGDNTKAYFSASLFDQEGIIKRDSYQKATVRFNVEQKMNKYIKYGINSNFVYSEANPLSGDNSSYQPYSAALKARPDVTPYDENGKIARYNFKNPLFAFEADETINWQRLGASFYLDVTPIEGLNWHPILSGNIHNKRRRTFSAPDTFRGENGDGKPTGYGAYYTENNRDFLIENVVTYKKTFFEDNLDLTLLGGHSFQKWSFEDSNLKGENFPSNDLKWLVSAGEINKGRSYINAVALESYFTRLQLSWKNKYHLMVSTRYDGSSKFREENRWGSFPAASLGWSISEEEFFNISAINQLKARASYGFTGNQSGISYASGLNLIGSGQNYNNNPGLATTSIFNPNLTWETAKSMNLGLDLGLFNRIDLSFDYYQNENLDLLSQISVPQLTGYRRMTANVGNTKNEGFEISLNAKLINKENLRWSFGTNFSYNDNEVVKIGDEKGWYTTGFVSIVKEGSPMGSFYLLEASGIAQKGGHVYKDKQGNEVTKVAAGDMIYVDQNGDGKIDDDDKKVFETGNAPMYGGFNTSFQYEAFDLSLSAQYSLGGKIYTMYKEDALNGGAVGAPSYSNNMLSEMMDYWSPENPNASNPRPHLASSISSWNTRRSSRFLESSDYLRISDLTLGYNFSKHFEGTPADLVKNFRLYVQFRNLYTFTNYSGVDPEATRGGKITAGVDQGGIPNVKSVLLGLNVKF